MKKSITLQTWAPKARQPVGEIVAYARQHFASRQRAEAYCADALVYNFGSDIERLCKELGQTTPWARQLAVQLIDWDRRSPRAFTGGLLAAIIARIEPRLKLA